MSRLIDLSHFIDETTPPFPGDDTLKLVHEKTVETDGFNSFRYSGGMHIGTHIDGPMHMTADKRMISDLPLSRFAGKGILIDAVGKRVLVLTARDRERIETGMIVLFHTGWDKKIGTKTYFEYFPDLDESSAIFLAEKKVKIVGFDSPSPDHSPYKIHEILLGNNVLILENLTNLSSLLHVQAFEIMAFPLKINADSSLVRAVAIVD